MEMSPLFEELLIFSSLLLGVVLLYILLKLHYVFAFGLVEKTGLSDIKKAKIQNIKQYVFMFLKILLAFGLITVLIFGTKMLIDGESLKAFIWGQWTKIPEGFWLSLLFTLLRIAVLIVVSRYILKLIYAFLDKRQAKTIEKKVYEKNHVEAVYRRFHNTIKYTVVLGIVYRITHFFPFLEIVSYVILVSLLLFFIISLFYLGIEVRQMLRKR